MLESVVGAILTSVAYAFVLKVPMDKICWSAINGGFAWFVYQLLQHSCGLVLATYVAGISMAIGSNILAYKLKTPVLVILIPSFIPFVPGGDIYKCIYYLLQDQAILSLHHLGNTIAISGMIALGNSSVEVIFRKIKKYKRQERKNKWKKYYC